MKNTFGKSKGWNRGTLEYGIHCCITPLFHHSCLLMLSISVLFFSTESFSAETVKFKYLQSIYVDDKGGGLKQPEGVACNEKSLLVVADSGNGRLLQFNFQDKTLKNGKEIRSSQLLYPIEVQLNSKEEIFALDGKQRRIVRLTPEGTVKGYLTFEGVPAPSTVVPRSFKVDRNDAIYVLDVFSSRVLILDMEGKYQKQIEFPGDHGFFSDLAIDPRGALLLLDSVRGRVFSAVKDAKGFVPLSKSLREHSNFLTYLTTDSRGTIYLVDRNGGGIIFLSQDGSFLGRQLSMGWNDGLLNYPSQLCLNEKGEAFIADRENSRIQIFAVSR